MTSMVERVAEALWQGEWSRAGNGGKRKVPWSEIDPVDQERWRYLARAAIEAQSEPSEKFLRALAERMHDARFSKSGEDYPIARNFIRSFIDAALSEEAR